MNSLRTVIESVTDSRSVPMLGAADIVRNLSAERAVDYLEAGLHRLGTESQAMRSRVPLPHGEFLVMPYAGEKLAGIKVCTVAPTGYSAARARIQAIYVAFDTVTLSPTAFIDGEALTVVRTAAVSGLFCRLAGITSADRIAIFGGGPQALGHAALLGSLLNPRSIGLRGRSQEHSSRLVERAHGAGLEVEVADSRFLAKADIVVCATTSASPVFDDDEVDADATIIAVGSHDPHLREIPADSMRSASVVVESIRSGLEECGDVILAIEEGAVSPTDLVTLQDLADDGAIRRLSPRKIFKSSGMAWEDAALAAGIVAEHLGCYAGDPALKPRDKSDPGTGTR